MVVAKDRIKTEEVESSEDECSFSSNSSEDVCFHIFLNSFIIFKTFA